VTGLRIRRRYLVAAMALIVLGIVGAALMYQSRLFRGRDLSEETFSLLDAIDPRKGLLIRNPATSEERQIDVGTELHQRVLTILDIECKPLHDRSTVRVMRMTTPYVIMQDGQEKLLIYIVGTVDVRLEGDSWRPGRPSLRQRLILQLREVLGFSRP